MAKRRERDTDFITTAAETIGRTLGTIAGKVDQLRGGRPDPLAQSGGSPASVQVPRREPAADDRRGVARVAGTKGTETEARKRSNPARKSGQRQVLKGTAKANRSAKDAPRGRTRSVPRKSAAKSHKGRKRA